MTEFSKLVELCVKLEGTNKKNEKSQFIGEFLNTLIEEEIATAVLLILGKIFSSTDSRTLNVSGATINRVMKRIADEKESSELEDRPPLSIIDVHKYFAEIASTSGKGSRKRIDDLLTELFILSNPQEVEYLMKMIAGEMRHGVADGVMIKAISEAVDAGLRKTQRAAMFLGDIGELARIAIVEGKEALLAVDLRLMGAVEPMLAQLAKSVDEVFAEYSGKTVLEYKYDGARVQIHKNGDEVAVFSRQRSDVTGSLPEIVELTRNSISADTAILDGEVVAVGEGDKPMPFQELMRRFKRVHEIESVMKEVPVKLYLFDLIYLNGESLIDSPYQQRWGMLKEISGGNFMAERIITEDPAEAKAFLQSAMDSGHEGLMAKSLTSNYAPGARGKKWFKIKPSETLDVVIIAGEWGHGRRQGWLSNYHLAVRNEETGEYMLVGKTFKGLTDQQFLEMTERLQSLKISEDDATVYVKPHIVAEIAYNEIQKSPHYKSGYALRFARITGFREDKSPEQADTISQLEKLYLKQFERKAKAGWS
ncbi:ATP-dependent DNA ligase [Candidatus Poribacteria bacterium]|nr:ATP-dependent DNA ligase [Candidatus Poribacteria bacterium]